MFLSILQDGIFAAIAAIGFSVISQPPRRALIYVALIAAIGHSLRYILMNPKLGDMHIVTSTFIAAIVVGVLAVIISPVAKMPAETALFPALLPMVPGIYAYKAFAGAAMCLSGNTQVSFDHAFYLFGYNAVVCFFILLSMAAGSTIPIFILRSISFRATRSD